MTLSHMFAVLLCVLQVQRRGLALELVSSTRVGETAVAAPLQPALTLPDKSAKNVIYNILKLTKKGLATGTVFSYSS